MSDPTPTSPPTDPKAGLIVVAASQLVPLFRTKSTGYRGAHKMAMSAIAAYHPEARSDYVNIARTIAFSMAALALLANAATADMPMPDLMRVYGRANALNRSADQSERTMIRRRTYHAANPPAELPAWMDPGLESPESEAPADDAVIQAAVAEAMREYDAAVTPPPAEAPPQFGPAAPATGTNPAAAPHYAIRGTGLPSPRPSSGIARPDQPRTTPYKTTLLRNAAMPPAAIRSTG
jgi:hypothetical protein